MEDKKAKVSEAQGADFTPTLDQVRSFLKKDMATAITCLDAIYRDENTMNAVADYLYGRWMNARNASELKKQTELDLK